MKRSRPLALILLLVTFGVGALAGMALEEATGIDWFEFLDRDDDDAAPLLAGLDLTDDQRERAEEILDRQDDLLEDYWEQRLPEIREILDQSYGEIGLLLTPEQRETFDRRVRALEGRIPEHPGD